MRFNSKLHNRKNERNALVFIALFERPILCSSSWMLAYGNVADPVNYGKDKEESEREREKAKEKQMKRRPKANIQH